MSETLFSLERNKFLCNLNILEYVNTDFSFNLGSMDLGTSEFTIRLDPFFQGLRETSQSINYAIIPFVIPRGKRAAMFACMSQVISK